MALCTGCLPLKSTALWGSAFSVGRESRSRLVQCLSDVSMATSTWISWNIPCLSRKGPWISSSTPSFHTEGERDQRGATPGGEWNVGISWKTWK